MLDAGEVRLFLHHSLHSHASAETETLRERNEEGKYKQKSGPTSLEKSGRFCLVEKATDYVPVAFSTSPFVGMLLLIKKTQRSDSRDDSSEFTFSDRTSNLSSNCQPKRIHEFNA